MKLNSKLKKMNFEASTKNVFLSLNFFIDRLNVYLGCPLFYIPSWGFQLSGRLVISILLTVFLISIILFYLWQQFFSFLLTLLALLSNVKPLHWLNSHFLKIWVSLYFRDWRISSVVQTSATRCWRHLGSHWLLWYSSDHW